MEFFNQIAQQPWIKLLPIIFALIGAILAILKFRRGNRKRNLGFIKRSVTLVDNEQTSHQDILVTYKTEKILTLTITNLIIWNSGKIPVRRDDIAKLDGVKAEIGNNGKLLDAKLLKVSDPINNVSIKENLPLNQVEVDFEYLEQGQGLVLQMVHSGMGSEDVSVKGTVIGQGKIKSLESNLKRDALESFIEAPLQRIAPPKIEKFVIFCLILSVGLGLSAIALFCSPFWTSTALIILSIVYIVLAILYRTITKTKAPKEFEFIQN